MDLIDFRTTTWSHNHYFKSQDDGTYYGPCWVTPRPKVDDVILWETNYGYAEAKIISVESCRDPRDMYYVRSKIAKRHADPTIVSQEEIDEYFKQV
jgi:hypothetical protein